MKRASWRMEELALVRAQYGVMPTRRIADRLERSPSSVRNAAAQMGLSAGVSRAWTRAEECRLAVLYPKIGAVATAVKLGRSEMSVFQRARQLGVRGGRFWSPREDAQLRNLYADHSVREIAAVVGRSCSAVMGRAHELRLRKTPLWTEVDDRLLHSHVQSMGLPFMADFLGRSVSAVRRRCYALDLAAAAGGAG